jgi:hypothetical protein
MSSVHHQEYLNTVYTQWVFVTLVSVLDFLNRQIFLFYKTQVGLYSVGKNCCILVVKAARVCT